MAKDKETPEADTSGTETPAENPAVVKKKAPVKKTAVKKKGAKKKAPAKKKARSPLKKGSSTAFEEVDKYVSDNKKKIKLDDEVTLDLTDVRKPLPHLPTGGLIVDFAIGGYVNNHGIRPCPGLPRYKFTNLYGKPASGKTTLALKSAATTCAGGGTVGYIDFEHEVVPTYAEDLGVPIDDRRRFRLYQPETLEEGIKRMAILIRNGVDLVVIDSVGAGIPEAAMAAAKADKKTQLGLLATVWSKHFPTLKKLVARTGSAVLGISQVRSSMGQGGDTVQGGNAWKFFSALRMALRVVSQEKGRVYSPVTNSFEEQTIGAEVELRLDKVKVSAHQQHKFRFFLKWGLGIDDFRSCVGILSSHGKIKKGGGGWLTWDREGGEPIRMQGLEKLRNHMSGDTKLTDDFFAAAIGCLSSRGGLEETKAEGDEDDLDALLGEMGADGLDDGFGG